MATDLRKDLERTSSSQLARIIQVRCIQFFSFGTLSLTSFSISSVQDSRFSRRQLSIRPSPRPRPRQDRNVNRDFCLLVMSYMLVDESHLIELRLRTPSAMQSFRSPFSIPRGVLCTEFLPSSTSLVRSRRIHPAYYQKETHPADPPLSRYPCPQTEYACSPSIRHRYPASRPQHCRRSS